MGSCESVYVAVIKFVVATPADPNFAAQHFLAGFDWKFFRVSLALLIKASPC
jgi:hypothetical protein